MNKKIILFCSTLLFVVVSLIAKPKKSNQIELPPAPEKPKPPEWTSSQGRMKLFPNSEYISSLGIGFSADSAKSKAAAGISLSIKTEVSALTEVRHSESERDGVSSEFQSLDEVVTLITNQDVYSMDYTEPWRNDETTEYYCVAFIEKSVAWNRIKPKLDTINANVKTKLETADEDMTGFLRTLTFGEILAERNDFYALYDFAVLVNPSGAKSYVQTEEIFRNAEQTILLEKPKQTVWLTVNNDKNGMVYRAIAKTLENSGFTVSPERGKYVIEADVTVSVRGEGDAFVSYPGITVGVRSALGNQIASFSHTAKKTVGFEKSALEEKAYRTLEKAADEIFKL